MKNKVDLNTTSRNEHVPDIERFNRTIKERIRAIRASMPFEKIPKWLVYAIVRHCSRWLNVFCPKNSLSKTVSPRVIMTGRKFDYIEKVRVAIVAIALL